MQTQTTSNGITLPNGRVINLNSNTAPIRWLVEGKNPRIFFDPVLMHELETSILAQGVIQPIIVRVNEEEKLEVVAGGRRYRAAKKVMGEDYEMPISFKEYSQNQADAVAVIENFHRAPVAPTEEALNAAKILTRFSGDREETAKYLGWDLKVLDNRLALLALSPLVTTALNERTIKLGLAELLATLTRENQDKALPIILEKKMSIADVKQFILSKAKKMATAIFNREQCNTCQHNSDLQSNMFEESLGSGHCSNAPCYDAKTEAELQLRSDVLKDEYPMVKFIRPGDNFTVIRITAEGKNAVGPEQANACKGCANYGGGISMMPDSFGQAFKGQCFDPTCNADKVASYAKSLLPPPVEVEAKTQPASSSVASAKSSPTTNSTEKVVVPVKPPITSVADSPRVKEYREGIWRASLKHDLASKPNQSLSLLFGLAALGNISNVSSSKFKDAVKKLSPPESKVGTVGQIAKTTDQLSSETRNGLLNGLTISAVDSVEVNILLSMLDYLEVNIALHWIINEEFLTLLTKSEIEVVANEIGLKKHLDKTFAGLMSKSKVDFIKALLTCGFDFVGIVPKVMQYKK